jgi:hypothetical protein
MAVGRLAGCPTALLTYNAKEASVMLTLIFDIDGTLTDMWPIERAVLMNMVPETCRDQVNGLKLAGVNDLYSIYCQITRTRIGKIRFRDSYRESFAQLRAGRMLPKPLPFQAAFSIQDLGII